MNVILDAGGVLFNIAEFRNTIIRRVLSSSGFNNEVIDVGLSELKCFDKGYFESNKISDWDSEKKWLLARIECIVSNIDPGNNVLRDKLYMLAFDSFQYHLYDETVKCLEKLKKGHDLYILSNATATLDWAFDYLDIRRFFKGIVISSYVGYEKPDQRIYEHILNVIGMSSESCVFVDDRIENIDVAENCGIKSFHLDRKSGMTLYDFEVFVKEQDNVKA